MATTKAKKVLYFVPEFPRRTETFIQREIAKLIEFGNLDIQVLSLQKASAEFYKGVEEVTCFKRLSLLLSIKALCFFIAKPAKVLQAFKLVMQDFTKNPIKRVYFFLKAVGYTKIIQDFHVDHIHAHFMSDPSTIAMVASIILDIPFSVSGHAKDVFVEGTLVKEKAIRAKFVSVCNKAAYKKCKELAGDNENIFMVYHGVDADYIANFVSDIQKPVRPYIFTQGRFVEKKGLEYLVEAADILKQQGVDFEMHIVGGGGHLYQKLVDLINQKNLNDRVFIEGADKGVPYSQVVSFYKTADMFVLPSLETGEGDADGVPTAVIEASLASLPIVTTAAGSITDLITDNKTGLIIPQRDAQAIAVAVNKLLADPDLGVTLGKNACETAKEMFNMEENIGQLQRLLLL
ncbi:MAG: glycosyltransferase family 4 protein [uncultured bacterium]|nr:MAG: glycosyltransferase family 4 protein [uncultured bacterium]